ncbi:MAG: hypothetical protein WA941_10615, partial [Nitrososphaeraceae archaeon]
SQGRMPPNMMITPEARDSANVPDYDLLSVLSVDAMCKMRPLIFIDQGSGAMQCSCCSKGHY